MSLIDLFKEFHSRAIVDVYPPSARALFDTFIYDFNAAFWPEERVYSERELSRLTGLTPATTHRSLKFLADHGHIKTKSSKRGTIVKLTGVTWSTNGAPMKHQRSTCEAPVKHPDAVPNIRVREDVKDVKTLDKSLLLLNAGASACVNRNSAEDALEALQDYWEGTLRGGRLTFEHLSEIQALVESHGFDWVKAAMKEASDVNGGGNRYRSYGVNMQLFRGVVRRKLNPSPKPKPALKGGERDEQRYKPAYKQRTFDLSGTDDTPDWFKSGASASTKQGAF